MVRFTFRAPVAALAAALLAHGAAQAAPVKLPADMAVQLELQHHVNSGYTPAGSPIYFRVAKDVQIDGHVLIAKGTLVVGKMREAQERGMVGRSGTMSLGVRTVKAIDGTDVAIEADLAKQGRSRAGATVAWTLFWGIPGLITRGVNPYMEKGTELTATVLAETTIDWEKAPAPAASDFATFDTWSLVRFCREGATNLHFAGTDAAGQPVAGTYQLQVHIKKKG